MKSEEDILYQKGVSFSAKLDSNFSDNNLNNINNFDENDLESTSNNAEDDSNNGGEDEDDDDENVDDNLNRQKHHKNDNFNHRRTLTNQNLQNPDMISDDNDDNDNGDDGNISNSEFSKNVPDFKLINRDVNSNQYNHHQKQQYQMTTTDDDDDDDDSNDDDIDDDEEMVKSVTDFIQLSNSQITTSPTTPSISAVDFNNLEYYDIYYGKQDMSVYDDVNNNKLNLRPVNSVTYQTKHTTNNINRNVKLTKIESKTTAVISKVLSSPLPPPTTVTNYLNGHRNKNLHKNDTRPDNLNRKNITTIIGNSTQNNFNR